jgi:rhodanese-related sulfurtransferase
MQATLAEANQSTPEISTAEFLAVLDNRSAVVLDARPPREFAVSHVPGAINVAPQPGRPPHLYISDVAEVNRIVGGDKARPLVMYCKTKRLGVELVAAGHSAVRRYQLGAPGWRALAGRAMETDRSALGYIATDATAVWVDARSAEDATRSPVRGARNIPPSGLMAAKDSGVMKDAKDDGRLPMDDHNTRIVVFGPTELARAVADTIAREAFHNVSFVVATPAQVRAAIRR